MYIIVNHAKVKKKKLDILFVLWIVVFFKNTLDFLVYYFY